MSGATIAAEQQGYDLRMKLDKVQKELAEAEIEATDLRLQRDTSKTIWTKLSHGNYKVI